MTRGRIREVLLGIGHWVVVVVFSVLLALSLIHI